MIANSFFWVGVSSALSRSLTMLATLILAAFLSPDAFGVVTIANLITAALGLFRDFGMNQAIIYQKKDIGRAADTAMVLSVSVSLFLFAIGYLLAKPAAVFFRNPAVEDVIRVLPFSLVITAFSAIPSSLLEKEMDFKKRALPEVLSFLTYFVVSVTLALLGLSYWSIIFGYLALCIVGLVATFAVSPWHPSFRFHPSALKELIGFGTYSMFSTIAGFVIRNIDNFSVGRILGTTPLGSYDLAYRIGNVTTTQITHVVGKVAFPAYVKMDHDVRMMRNAYLKAYRWLALVAFPVATGIIVFVPSFFHIFYGDKWDAAIVPSQIIALYGLSRGLFSHAGGVFMTSGKIHEMFWITLGQLAVLGVAVYPVVANFGLIGMAVLLAVLNFFTVIIAALRIEKFLPDTIRRYPGLSFFPFVLSLAAIAVPVLVWTYVAGSLTLWPFIGLIVFCSLLYAAVVLVRNPELLGEIRGWISELRTYGDEPKTFPRDDDPIKRE
jgi:O-antigen/teichoic acid export membrane protein